MAAVILDLSVEVSTPTGNLELNVYPYQLTGESFTQETISHRKQEAVNPFVEGTYIVNSLRENVTTNISVWVRGATPAAMGASLETLKAAFDQSMFTAQVRLVDWTQTWQCFASDYAVTLQREFIHATMAKLDVQLLHHPGAPGWTNLVSVLDV